MITQYSSQYTSVESKEKKKQTNACMHAGFCLAWELAQNAPIIYTDSSQPKSGHIFIVGVSNT